MDKVKAFLNQNPVGKFLRDMGEAFAGAFIGVLITGLVNPLDVNVKALLLLATSAGATAVIAVARREGAVAAQALKDYFESDASK